MLKKLSLISLFSLLPATCVYAQTTVFAYLKNEEGKPVENAEVDLKESENDVKADKVGYFQLIGLMPGHYQIVISKPNFVTKVMEFDVNDERKKDLGEIVLYSELKGAEQGLTFIDGDGDSDETASQTSTVGLLQSSTDVFSRLAAFDLGAYWFRPRGIDGRSGEIMMNGISMRSSDDGNVDFGNWGGLNEITRYPEIATNHSPSEYAFGGVSAVLYKNTNASSYRKGFQFTQSITNRNYRYRTSLRYSSGMNKKGWAFTIMGARRWAQEGIQEGTFYDAYGTFLGVEKKVNDHHTVTFNYIGSPYRRSTSSPSTQEVYDYRGVHYNAYWGYQDGEKRSERVKNSFMPLFQLQDFWKISKNTSLWTSVSYQFGKYKASRLDWQNVANPSPIYYRNLPSYYTYLDPNASIPVESGQPPMTAQQAYQASLAAWRNGDASRTQLDWDRFYRNNMHQPAKDYYGSYGRRALIMLVNDVNEDKVWNAATHLSHNFNDTTKFLFNVSYQNYRSEQYREVNDLLGADFALNRDPFAATNQPGKTGMFNEGEGNVAKKEGDKIGYDYIFSRQEVKVNPALKFKTGNFDILVSGSASYSNSKREGLFKHYLYEDSFGKSKDYKFWNFGLKGQATYRIDGRNFIVYNGAVFSQAPYLEDLFINPRVNSSVAPNLKSTVYVANDLSYVLNSPFVKLRLTGYMVDTENETAVQRFFADGISINTEGESGQTIIQSAFLTQVMSNVEKRNMGGELGLDVKITPSLSFQGLASYGQFTYKNNPTTYFASDAAGLFKDPVTGEATPFLEFGEAHIKDYRQGGTAQTGFSAGLRYSSPKYWWVGGNWNYLGDNYLDPSALLRTENFLQNPVTGTPYVDATPEELARLLNQRKLPSAHFINVNAGKSWLLGKYYLLITASVNNVFDNTNYITGGFEQTRNVKFNDFKEDTDRANPVFAPRYWYTQGRSYFINLQLRF